MTFGHLLLAHGFRSHGNYWRNADEAHCFEPLIDHWLVPEPAPTTVPERVPVGR